VIDAAILEPIEASFPANILAIMSERPLQAKLAALGHLHTLAPLAAIH
jgi:hypothetical protein